MLLRLTMECGAEDGGLLEGIKPHVKMPVLFLLQSLIMPSWQHAHIKCVCECIDSTKDDAMAKTRRGENKKIFFLHSCNDNISSRHLKAELNSGMMRICTSRKVCRRESSISIKQLKSVLRIHDQFKLWAVRRQDGGSSCGPRMRKLRRQLKGIRAQFGLREKTLLESGLSYWLKRLCLVYCLPCWSFAEKTWWFSCKFA